MGSLKTAFMITALSSALCACAANNSSGSIPEKGLTVEQIYQVVDEDNHQDIKSIRSKLTHYRTKGKGGQSNYQNNDKLADNLGRTKGEAFQPMENPMVPIYVYSHIALIGDEQVVKPAYTTAFFLFKRNQFALNSERY